MFTFDRDTATLVAIVVCIAATAYLYRELKKTREDFTAALAEQQEPEPPAPVMVTAPPPVPPVPKVMTTRKKAASTETDPTE